MCPVQVWQTSESVVNACSQLDWKRCVAVHLWFMLPPTASVADALAEYQDAFQVSHAAALQAKGRLPARLATARTPKTSLRGNSNSTVVGTAHAIISKQTKCREHFK